MYWEVSTDLLEIKERGHHPSQGEGRIRRYLPGMLLSGECFVHSFLGGSLAWRLRVYSIDQNLSIFDDQLDFPGVSDILQRIAGNGNDVC